MDENVAGSMDCIPSFSTVGFRLLYVNSAASLSLVYPRSGDIPESEGQLRMEATSCMLTSGKRMIEEKSVVRKTQRPKLTEKVRTRKSRFMLEKSKVWQTDSVPEKGHSKEL